MPEAIYWFAAIVLLVCERVVEGVGKRWEEERAN